MEDFVDDFCGESSLDLKRALSFESCSDFLFDERLMFQSANLPSINTNQDPNSLYLSNASELLESSLSAAAVSLAPPSSADSITDDFLFTTCPQSDDSSHMLHHTAMNRTTSSSNIHTPPTTSTESIVESFPPPLTVNCQLSAESATCQVPSSIEVPCFSGDQDNDVHVSSIEKQFQLDNAVDTQDIYTLFKSSSHGNYFSFLQQLFINVNSIPVAQFLEINNRLLKCACFQRHNYWLRIALEIVSFLYYTIDYLIGNCPNKFYHRSFRPFLSIEKGQCSSSFDDIAKSEVLTWVGISINDRVLLTWTDVWWSFRFSFYTPKVWHSHTVHNKQCVKSSCPPQGQKIMRKTKVVSRNLKRTNASSNANASISARKKAKASISSGTGTNYETFNNNLSNANNVECGDVVFLDDSFQLFDHENALPIESYLDYTLDGPSCLSETSTEYSGSNSNSLMTASECATSLDFDQRSQSNFSGLQESSTSLLNDRYNHFDSFFPTTLSFFHQQEKERFAKPDSFFVYTLSNMETSIVGPIYGASLALNNHITDYSLLEKNVLKPSNSNIGNVYIVDLVRDAIARLPEGNGSRLDVFNLFKQSQFVNLNFVSQNDNLLNGVVGKCLEILHQCQSPCVDLLVDFTGKSVWVYLPPIDSISSASKSNNVSSTDGSNNCVRNEPPQQYSFVVTSKNTTDLSQCHSNNEEVSVATISATPSQLMGVVNDHLFLDTITTCSYKKSATLVKYANSSQFKILPVRGRPKSLRLSSKTLCKSAFQVNKQNKNQQDSISLSKSQIESAVNANSQCVLLVPAESERRSAKYSASVKSHHYGKQLPCKRSVSSTSTTSITCTQKTSSVVKAKSMRTCGNGTLSKNGANPSTTQCSTTVVSFGSLNSAKFMSPSSVC